MNAADTNLNTKQKILQAARQLFAQHGFEGTSIRKIAAQAESNIAAINYHFENKENLYWAVLTDAYERVESYAKQIFNRSSSAEDFAVELFDQFLKESDVLRNTLKLMLSDEFDPAEGNPLGEKIRAHAGPPGSPYLAELIVKEIPYSLSPIGTWWGTKAIFGSLIHWASMCHSSPVKMDPDLAPLLSPTQIRQDVTWMIRAHLDYLKNNPALFADNQDQK